jgi:hypothetical protein
MGEVRLDDACVCFACGGGPQCAFWPFVAVVESALCVTACIVWLDVSDETGRDGVHFCAAIVLGCHGSIICMFAGVPCTRVVLTGTCLLAATHAWLRQSPYVLRWQNAYDIVVTVAMLQLLQEPGQLAAVVSALSSAFAALIITTLWLFQHHKRSDASLRQTQRPSS